MSLEVTSLILFIVFLESFLLVKAYKGLASKFNLVDKPNERSSHIAPTPLGAGVVFLFCLLPAIAAIFYLEGLGLKPFYILVAGSLVYTIMGFIDDVKALPALFRLVPQVVVSVWILLELTSFLEVPFVVKFLPWDSQLLAFGFGVLFLCWMVNLFNFMDGLDGLVGSQAFVIGLSSFALSLMQENQNVAVLYCLISIIILPFLYFNWRPAKVFMGDAGAYFLGFFFAVLGLFGKIEFNLSLVAQVIVMGTLICDATLTLLLRIASTGRAFKAHRTHGFQILRHKYKWRTSRIALSYVALTAFWFFPWSILAVYYPSIAVFICFLSYSPVLIGFYILGVGRDF